MIPHRVFGSRGNKDYLDRRGAYIVPFDGDNVGLIKTEKGLFLIGGGQIPHETDEQTIIRECLEETGYSALVGECVCSAEAYMYHPSIGFFHPIQKYYLGIISDVYIDKREKTHSLVWLNYNNAKNNLYAEMQNWALEKCIKYYLSCRKGE